MGLYCYKQVKAGQIMEDKVTVVTPTWNSAKYIRETIASVQAQTYQNWEMIIVDDCSTDNTVELVKDIVKRDSRIRLIEQNENQGAAIARNIAVQNGTGRYVAYLDSDDCWKPDKLEKQVKFMLSKDCGFSCTSYEVIDFEGKSLNKIVHMLDKVDYRGFLTNNLLQTVGIMVDTYKVDKKYNADISPRENINQIKNICYKFIANFDNKSQKNLLFTGNTGLGKTFLSSAIANEILKKGKNVLYQTAPVMLDAILDYRFGKTKGSNILDSILSVDLLIIDDLGAENPSNIKSSELFNIINTRLLNQNKITKTIISTNLNLRNLYSNYDERIISRIIGNYDIRYFFGDDIRFKNVR